MKSKNARPKSLSHQELEKYALAAPSPEDDPESELYAEEDEYTKKVASATQAEIDEKALDRNTPKTNDTKHYVTMVDYGARADGATDDSGAFDAAILAASAGDTIYVPRGTYKLSDNVTIPAGMEVEFESGASLSIDTGKTFTVTGTLRAGLYEIFTGAGSVSLADGAVAEIHPAWWGNAVIQTFTENDLTPSVAQGMYFKTNNTSAKTITMFDDGFTGQVIRVIINDANTTIDFTGTNLKRNPGSDWLPNSGDHMTCLFDGTNWYCDTGGGDLSSAVSVYLSADQSLTASTEARVEFDTEVYDVLGEFNTTTHIFTATVAGKYLINWQVAFKVDSADDTLKVYLFKNLPAGFSTSPTYNKVRSLAESPSISSHTMAASVVLDLSVDDTIQLWVENLDNNDEVDGGNALSTFMTITRIQ